MSEPVGYWRPRVMRHVRDSGSVEFAFHDVYFSHDGLVQSFTIDARSDRKATIQELEVWIRSNLAESQLGIVCGDQGYTHNADDLLLWLEHLSDPPIDYNGGA